MIVVWFRTRERECGEEDGLGCNLRVELVL